MKITVKLFATLQLGRFEQEEMSLEQDTQVSSVLERLGISRQDAAIIFINGIHAEVNSVLKEGDTLAIFPPIGGG